MASPRARWADSQLYGLVRIETKIDSECLLEENKMDALELLKTDHKKVKELFKKAEGNENQKQQKQLFEQIKTELETHTHIATATLNLKR